MGKKGLNILPAILMAAVLLLSACSTKKNTAMSRFWQAFNTRYNVYYNGETHYIEQLSEMENNYEDDYSQRVMIHPAEAYSNPKAPQPGADFQRTITKMQKAIQLHSIKKRPKKKAGKSNDKKYKEWLKRDEYNPFIHNAWMLMGKAQYMKGDFLASASTFHYVSRHFTWLPDVVAESQLWEVRSYCALGWLTEADNVVTHIHREKIQSGKIKTLYDLTVGNFYVKSKKDSLAVKYLAAAAKKSRGSQKVRINFLLGQIYSDIGDKQNAYKAFNAVSGANGATYRTRFNARIKQSAVYSGKNINSEVRSLKAMTRYDRNKDYLDQIYYAVGNLYLSRADTTNAISNFVLAAQKSTRNGIDKAISQLTLGGIYFARHEYDKAQPCYAEAIPLINEDYPSYKLLKKRSDVLDELAVYAQNVKLQDSLLTLSKLSPEEQQKVAQHLVDELKKKEKEEAETAKREEYLAQQSAKGNQLGSTNSSAPTTYQINNDKSWYFYNTATKNAGKTAFQKSWGSRKLEDDWRRRNKSTFSMDEFETANNNDNDSDSNNTEQTNDSTAVDKERLKKEEDPHFVEYYLKQIPKTDAERKTSNDIIQEGLYNMGVILKDKLEDYPSSIAEFTKLLNRYPDNVYRLDTYYNMYLMYMRMNDLAMAERYRLLIVNDFSDSSYGQAMKDSRYFDNLRNMQQEQEDLYARAYDAYINNRNSEVHSAYEDVSKRYPLSKIMPKFMFIDALSYVTEKKYDKFRSTLKEMLERYPETDITPVASSMLKQLAQGRKLQGGGSNVRGMIWATRLSSDSTAADIEKKFTPFTEGKDKPQYYVMAYPTDSVSANELLYKVARHNFNSFVVKDFDLEQMTFGRIGLLIIKGFENFDEVSHYKTVLEADKEIDIPPMVRHVLISVDNFTLLLNEGRSLEDYFNYLEEENIKKVEGSVPDDEGAETEEGEDTETENLEEGENNDGGETDQ